MAPKTRFIRLIIYRLLPEIYSWLWRCITAGGGLFPSCPMEVPLRLRLVSLFYSLEVPLKMKIILVVYRPSLCQDVIFIFKFEQSSYLFLLKNSRPCRDLNLGLSRYQADMLPIELSWLGLQSVLSKNCNYIKTCFQIRRLF